MTADVRVFDDYEAMSQEAAAIIAKSASQAQQERGSFAVALSGGKTPKRAYEILATLSMSWASTTVMLVDERYVPPSDPSSNETMIRQALIDQVSPAEFIPIYESGGVDHAAAVFASRVGAALQRTGKLDLCVLGMGPDGHTASLFPGSTALQESVALAAVSQGAPPVRERVTLTFPVLLACRQSVFLVSGDDKAEMLRQVMDPTCELPAARVAHASNATWLVDRAAARLLSG